MSKRNIEQLLADKIQPTLGGMKLVDGNVRRVARLADGGVILFAAAGVSMPSEDDQQKIVSPAPGISKASTPSGTVVDAS